MTKTHIAEILLLLCLTVPLWVMAFRRTAGSAIAAALIWFSGRYLYAGLEQSSPSGAGQPSWLLIACAIGVAAGCVVAVMAWKTKVH